MKWFELSEADQKEIITQTSTKASLPEAAVEKDLWVMLVLNAIFNSEYASHFVFKGGTSLSKAWNVIDRFSEDIDLAMDRSFFGFDGKLNSSKVKKLRKASCKFASDTFTKTLESELNSLGAKNFEISTLDFEDSDTDPIAIEIKFQSVTEEIEYLSPRILVEISSRSLREPFEDRTLQSHITEIFPEEQFADAPREFPSVTPVRTMIEKMFLLHEEFQKPKEKKIRSERMSRHLFDLGKLSETQYRLEALEDKELYNTIIEHREMLTKISWVDYSKHKHATLNFIPPDEVITEWKNDYEAMRESMFRGEKESFEDLIVRLKELNREFNAVTV